jgi:hypothetical protein
LAQELDQEFVGGALRLGGADEVFDFGHVFRIGDSERSDIWR